jgi:SAM-dependent methyltransferase
MREAASAGAPCGHEIGGAMESVEGHYENLLARHYTWMRGDSGSSVREYRAFFEQAGISIRSGGRALDLGAGSGFQSLALADLGFEVLAVDTSEALLEELRAGVGKRKVRPVLGDMRDSGTYAQAGPFEVAVCMGDTLSHLRSYEEVGVLFGDLRGALERGGSLVLEFRDYTAELKGADRAIPVRLDDDRIMATFLEYEAVRVNVHDIVFEKGADGWEMRKSAYSKLRLSTEVVSSFPGRNGFQIVERSEDKGFTTIVARA